MQKDKSGARTLRRLSRAAPVTHQARLRPQNSNFSDKEATSENATRIASLRLLLEKVDGDTVKLASAAQLNLHRLELTLKGERLLGSELATHIEETLALKQGWLDKPHALEDINGKTTDILWGRDISDFEKELRLTEKKVKELMKAAGHTQKSAPVPVAQEQSELCLQDLQRIDNLDLLTQTRGTKTQLARLLNVSGSTVTFLFKRPFKDDYARKVEAALLLPSGWLDEPRTADEIPQKTHEILQPSKRQNKASTPAANIPMSASSAGLVLNLNSPTSELELVSLPALNTSVKYMGALRLNTQPQTEALLCADYEQEPMSEEKQQAAIALTKMTAPDPQIAPKTEAAEVGAPCAPVETAPASMLESTVAPPSPQSSAPVLPTYCVPSAPEAPQPAPVFQEEVGPLTEALIKLLTQQAQQGKFTEKDAYQLLGTLSGF